MKAEARGAAPSVSRHPDALIAVAKARWSPLWTVCLFSGGTDSGVLAHRCRDSYDELLYIDTGTAIPGVEDHVREFANRLGKGLWIRRSGDAYRRMVLDDELWRHRYRKLASRRRRPFSIEEMRTADRLAGRTSAREFGEAPYGFPGKGQHSKAYVLLKVRRLEDVLREVEAGHPRRSTVLFLSGILMHRSGECNCGAFARADEERRLISSLWPEWWSGSIARLEREAAALGIRWCRWGGFDLRGVQAAGSTAGRPGLLCSSCQSRSFDGGEAAVVAAHQGAPEAALGRRSRARSPRDHARRRAGAKLRSSRHPEAAS